MSLNSSEPKTWKKKWHTIGQMNVDNLWFDLCWTCVAFGLLNIGRSIKHIGRTQWGIGKKVIGAWSQGHK